MVNHMPELAKMLGVEPDEEFKISQEPGSLYKFDSSFGMLMNIKEDGSLWQAASCDLERLIYGVYTIKRKPWKPQDGENYWYVDERGDAWCNEFDDCEYVSGHMNYYKLGNCYRTKKKAEANRDKWVAFYASDEVLEV